MKRRSVMAREAAAAATADARECACSRINRAILVVWLQSSNSIVALKDAYPLLLHVCWRLLSQSLHSSPAATTATLSHLPHCRTLPQHTRTGTHTALQPLQAVDYIH